MSTEDIYAEFQRAADPEYLQQVLRGASQKELLGFLERGNMPAPSPQHDPPATLDDDAALLHELYRSYELPEEDTDSLPLNPGF